MKPIIKWKGGKQKLLLQMVKYFPQNVQYFVDPFVGGGSVRGFFENVPASIGDLNPDLVLTFRMIRDRPKDVINALELHRELHSEQYYYQVRSKHRLDQVGTAARLLYLNKTCFNGIWRVNQAGKNNVPKGDNDSPTWDYSLLLEWSKLLQGDMIWHTDFETYQYENLEPGSFVYFDPPYYGDSGQYTKKPFTWEDQVRLGKLFRRLTDLGINAMISNSYTKHTCTLYKNFNVHFVQRNGTISVGDRSQVKEILVTNY